MKIATIDGWESEIIEWANRRGILDNSTAQIQFGKLLEEVAELGMAQAKFDSIGMGSAAEQMIATTQDHEAIIDAIGDCVVVLTIIAELHGESLGYCMNRAFDVISKRKGQMVNGVFVRDGERCES